MKRINQYEDGFAYHNDKYGHSVAIICDKDISRSYLLSSPEVIKHFTCSTNMDMKFIMLMNVKKPTIVGIVTFISTINRV